MKNAAKEHPSPRILISGSLYVRSTTQTLELTGLASRRSQAREAAFAALRWSRRDLAADPSARTATHTLTLQGVEVVVSRAPNPETDEQTSLTIQAQVLDAEVTLEADLQLVHGQANVVALRDAR